MSRWSIEIRPCRSIPPPTPSRCLRRPRRSRAASLAAQAPQSAASRNTRTYSGNPISLDFQGADLRAVLRMFSEISGLNIVIDPAVQGTVDVMLTEVPWDQALDIILRSNKLGYLLDGTIVIAPSISWNTHCLTHVDVPTCTKFCIA